MLMLAMTNKGVCLRKNNKQIRTILNSNIIFTNCAAAVVDIGSSVIGRAVGWRCAAKRWRSGSNDHYSSDPHPPPAPAHRHHTPLLTLVNICACDLLQSVLDEGPWRSAANWVEFCCARPRSWKHCIINVPGERAREKEQGGMMDRWVGGGHGVRGQVSCPDTGWLPWRLPDRRPLSSARLMTSKPPT